MDGGRKLLVDMAFNGEEALLKVKAHEYDVVLAGVMMPRLRGDEFYLEATGLRTELAARFIFMTGCRRPTDPRLPFPTGGEVSGKTFRDRRTDWLRPGTARFFRLAEPCLRWCPSNGRTLSRAREQDTEISAVQRGSDLSERLLL